MARWPHFCAAALLATSITVIGSDNVQDIQPRTVLMQPGLQGDIAKLTQLKRGSGAMPSPILVEHTATIDADGSLRLGCGNRPVHDFRAMTRQQEGTQP